MRKDDDDGDASDFADALDLSGLDYLVNVMPEELASVMGDAGDKSLFQLGVENEHGLTGQVNQASLDYAKNRAAEMVGKKWVDGELVDNPDAEWVITDSTRDDLRGIIGDVYSGDLEASDLSDAIMNAGSFSEDRADLIARTETIKANAQGSLEGYRAARDAGVKVKKAWNPDAGACPICQENGDAGAIDLDEDFPSGDDAPPAHPNCECDLVPEVEEDEESDDTAED